MSRKTRKLMWSVPLIAAVAVIGALAAFGTLGLGNVFANELLDNPQNLKVNAADGDLGRTTLVLNWEAPASGAPDMYRIDVSTNNQKFTNLAEVSGTTLTYSHVVRPRGMDRDPKDGKLRYYRVYAKNSHGYGSVSTSESASTKALEVPGEVMRVTGSSRSPTVITVNWSMPNDGGADILGYCIFAVSTAQDTMVAADIAAEDRNPVGVTDANCRKEFLLNGPGKNDATSTTGTPTGTTIDGDVIRILPATTYSHMKLSAKEEWSYQVYAFNRFGHSETTSGERTIETKAANDPTAPKDLFVLQAESTDGGPVIHLYWNGPDDGGQPISSYRVEVTSDRNSWPETLVDPAVNTNLDALDDDGAKAAQTTLLMHSTDTGAMVAVITLLVATQTAAEPYQLVHTVPALPGFTEDGDTLYYRVRTVTGSGATEKTSPYSDPESIKIVDDDQVDAVLRGGNSHPWHPVRSSHRRASHQGRCSRA